MKIKMFALQAGPDGVREIGKVYDVPEKEAKELIAGGYAELVESASSDAEKETVQPRAATRTSNRSANKPEAVTPNVQPADDSSARGDEAKG